MNMTLQELASLREKLMASSKEAAVVGRKAHSTSTTGINGNWAGQYARLSYNQETTTQKVVELLGQGFVFKSAAVLDHMVKPVGTLEEYCVEAQSRKERRAAARKAKYEADKAAAIAAGTWVEPAKASRKTVSKAELAEFKAWKAAMEAAAKAA